VWWERLRQILGGPARPPCARAVAVFETLSTYLTTAPVCVDTYHNQNTRKGINYNEQVLTKAKVSGGLTSFTDTLSGQVYAQPLFLPQIKMSDGHLHNVVFVATETNDVYAWDGDSAQTTPYWHTSLLTPPLQSTRYQVTAGAPPGVDIPCNNIEPDVGITGTPAITITSSTASEIDGATIFVVSRSKNTNAIPATTYYQTLYALDATSGSVVAWTDITATVNTVSFNPLHQNQRPALLYQGGQVYIGWGSHCDLTSQHGGPSWYGWLMSYKLTGSSFGSGPTGGWLTSSNPEAGIWQSGSGPAGDGTNLYFGTGNGSTTAAPNGSACTGCYGNSIVKLNGTPSSGTFTVLDSFTPYDHPYRFCDDGDMGSGGLVLLQGTGLTPSNLIVQSGKEGNIYMLNSNTGSMGGYGGTTGIFNCPVTSTGTDNIVQAIYGDLCTAAQGDPECGLQGSPVFWSNSGNLNVFFGPRCQPIKQYSLQGPNATLSFANETIAGGTTNSSCPSSTNPVFPYPGASLAISQYSASGAILWALQTDNSCLSHAPQAPILYAYDAANIGTAAALFSSSAGTGCAVRFTIPTVVNGHVYIGNGGQLVVFH
jgi:hypothetical protein